MSLTNKLLEIGNHNVPSINSSQMRKESAPKSKGRWIEEDNAEFRNIQYYREFLVNSYINDIEQPNDGPSCEIYHSFQKLLWESGGGREPICMVGIIGVPLSRFMFPVFNENQQIRSIGGLTKIFFGEHCRGIIYPVKRTSTNWEWTKSFGRLFRELEVTDFSSPPLLLFVPNRYAIEKIQSRLNVINTELSNDQFKVLVIAWAHICGSLTTPHRKSLLYHILYLMFASRIGIHLLLIQKYKKTIFEIENMLVLSPEDSYYQDKLVDYKRYASYHSINIGLHVDYSPTGELGDIMDIINDYFPKENNNTIDFEFKTNLWVEIGNEPNVTVRAGRSMNILNEIKINSSDISKIFISYDNNSDLITKITSCIDQNIGQNKMDTQSL